MRRPLLPMLLAASVVLATACGSSDSNSRLGGERPTGKPTATIGGVGLYVEPRATQFAAQHAVDLQAVLRPVIERAAGALHSPKTTIVVRMAARSTIYEVGVGGSTHPTQGRIAMSLADGSDDEKERRALLIWLPQGVAHEMNHSARILDGPGYGTSLLDTMVSEGLADQFARTVVQTPQPPWTTALTQVQAADLWKRVQPLLNTRRLSTNREWLFGSDDVPRWTAYDLGSRIVAAQRKQRADESWYDLTREDSSDILSESHYQDGE